MQKARLTEDRISDQELLADLGAALSRQSESGRPLVVTHEGQPSAVLISPDMFEALAREKEVVALVLQGLHDVVAGDLVDDDEVWADINSLLASSSNLRS